MACRLSRDERDEISVGLVSGESLRGIARRLGRDPATIKREVDRNGGREAYRPGRADQRARVVACRPRLRRLQADRRLARLVLELLDDRWSPAPIAAHLKSLGYRICHETIYAELYRVDSVFDSGWRRLFRPRPYQSRMRRTRTGRDTQPLGDISLITGVDPGEKTKPGYWEGDLLVGSRSLSACVVLVERTSKKIILGSLGSQTADEVCDRIVTMFTQVPPPLRRILVWDQGRELTRWDQIQHQTGIDVFFCQPKSPWQKPLVEHTCGLLRRWLPRNSSLNQPQPALDHIARLLNTMPRRSLNWHTPNQVYNTRVATTD
jgi:IS30 family transposase